MQPSFELLANLHITDQVYDEGWSGEICALWNALLAPPFKLTERLWLQNTAGDPDFNPHDVIIAHDDRGKLVGLALTKRYSLKTLSLRPGLDNYRDLGYIPALLVAKRYQGHGLGRRLLAEAEQKLWEKGVSQIRLGESFRQLFPAIPTTLTQAQEFFKAAGYEFGELSYDLEGRVAPELYEPTLRGVASGLSYRQASETDEAGLLAFLDRVFPGRWAYEVRLYLEQGGNIGDITILLDTQQTVQGFLMTHRPQNRIIGPSVYWLSDQPEWGGMGPLGISSELRGQGAGLGIVAAGMEYLYSQGVEQARIDWTGLTEFYGRLGFQPVFTYQYARKNRPSTP